MRSLITPLLLLVSLSVQGQATTNRYFGLVPPRTPEPFAPPLLSGSSYILTNLALAPGFQHAAFSFLDPSGSAEVANTIHESRKIRGEWSVPTRVDPFGAKLPAGEGAFSPDGRWFYFSSERPPGGKWRPRVFRAPVHRGVFGAPVLVDLAVPQTAATYYPRPLANGDLHFTSKGSVGGDDLFVARANSGRFDPPQPLSGDFNSVKDDWDLVESRNGKLRFWASARDGGLGKTDIYYSRLEQASWSPARHLRDVSTAALETAPVLSPDDQVLFFLRRENGRERMFWVRVDSVLATP